MQELVSILVPLYNSEQYIADTIESALNQTWKNKEIIIVDDGSTDNSYLIAKSYESKNVRIFRQKHQGACVARNFAFVKSNGNYIQYLDADDLMAPDKIEKQIAYFKQFGNNICTSCKSIRFLNCNSVFYDTGKNVSKDYKYPLDYLIDLWETGDYLGIHAWLIPRHIIYKTGEWDINLKRFQDTDFIIRVLNHTKEVKYVSDCLVYYRDSPNSISKTNYNIYEESSCYLITKVINDILLPVEYKKVNPAAIVYLSNAIYRWYPRFPDLVQTGLITLKKMDAKIEVKHKNVLFTFLIYVIGWKKTRNIELKFYKIVRRFSRIKRKVLSYV
ncbi:MAG: glycosyltransferase family 2 protein [Enterococcus sp.]|nr:glycosyltransferase family 2 protein [Enterococcus sp.]